VPDFVKDEVESGATEESCCDVMLTYLAAYSRVGTAISVLCSNSSPSYLARRQRKLLSSLPWFGSVFNRLWPPHLGVARRIGAIWYHAAVPQARNPVMCYCVDVFCDGPKVDERKGSD
jgi:hypothetical protein